MHVSDNVRNIGRLTVYFEQDLAMESEATSPLQRVDIRSVSNDSPPLDDNNNKNESVQSIESTDYNNMTHPPVVRRQKKDNSTRSLSRSRDRNFVFAAGDVVVGGARTVARTFKRMSLIESSSSSNNNTAGGSLREHSTKESKAQNGVERLKANSKHKQQYNSTP